MYSLNSTMAKKAEAGGYIEDSGAYIGVFTRAEDITSKGGAKGIEFDFKSDDGSSANRLQLWTIGRDGNYIQGMYMVNALMACLKLREITPKTGWVEKWNWDTKAKEKQQAEVFPDLMNKSIGVVIQMEEYEKMNGDIGQRPVIVRFFEPKSMMTASEILDSKAVPQELDKFMKRIEANPVKRLKKTSNQAPASAPSGGPQIEDDDIPF